MVAPKYALLEHERRFVVAPTRIPGLDAASAVLIEDRYLTGSRLRLRRTTSADCVVHKLAKKYPGATPMSRPLTNIYLDAAEFALLSQVPARVLSKRRFRTNGRFVVDVFDGALGGLVLAEYEASRALVGAVVMPAWAAVEVTADRHYDGGSICRWTPSDLADHRARFG